MAEKNPGCVSSLGLLDTGSGHRMLSLGAEISGQTWA